MIPVLIEEDLTLSFAEEIRGELKIVIGAEDPVAGRFLVRLLKHRRFLVIVDHFSEMNDATRKAINPKDPEVQRHAGPCREGAGCVQSRQHIHPARLQSDRRTWRR